MTIVLSKAERAEKSLGLKAMAKSHLSGEKGRCDMFRLIDWGKSMYGGYYANYVNDIIGEYTGMLGIHADTYKELCEKLAAYGLKAERAKRFDN